MIEKIEILSISLLDEQRLLVNDLKRLARRLGIEFGWHYLLDLVWIINQLGEVKGKRILDAGAGVGILQWYLANRGAAVYSVDRDWRGHLPEHYRIYFRLEGLRAGDLPSSRSAHRKEKANVLEPLHNSLRLARDVARMGVANRAEGRVILYNQDLNDMPDISTASIDVVVAVSALEHNHPDELKTVVNELLRTLKPGGRLLATLCAARDQDWFHEPSQGWCYSAATLRNKFDLPLETPSNYDCYDELFSALIECAELRDNLARFYARSGDNGMPWGVWNPQYQPVGVCKVKETV
jgi:SAM-dependent methyltransferase